MKISYTKNFIKNSRKLPSTVRERLIGKIVIFSNTPLHYQLRNHALKGKYKEYRSIDITGDYRALYYVVEDEAIFVMVGTHSELYG